MAQLEFGGVKFTGGKMVAVFTALSTLGGALWGGFEVYSRYQSMEKKIASYTAPDLSGFDKRLLVLETKVDEELRLVREEMTVLQERVTKFTRYLAISGQIHGQTQPRYILVCPIWKSDLDKWIQKLERPCVYLKKQSDKLYPQRKSVLTAR